MSLITLTYVFSAGSTIIAAQHNTNFATIYSDYNGNINNSNIASGAGITYSKLTLTGGVVDSDVSTMAAIANSKLNLTTISQNVKLTGQVLIGSVHQGDVFYDNGTQITRLTSGTSGQFLQTQGTSANPQWATVINSQSNVLFQYIGQVDQEGTSAGEYSGTSFQPHGVAGNYRFLQIEGSTYTKIWSSKFIKILGINTVTVYTRIWGQINSGQALFQMTIGSSSGTISGTIGQTTPEWNTFTIDVSGLTNGTTYDVSALIYNFTGTGNEAYCSDIIGFGS